MADECEIASEVSDRWLAGAIAYATSAVPGGKLTPKGRCHWCDEKLEGELEGQIFCPPPDEHTPGCRDDWQKHEAARKRNGL